MKRSERLLLAVAVVVGLVLLVMGLRENAREMAVAPTAISSAPEQPGTPWDPSSAVRSPENCPESDQRRGVVWVGADGGQSFTRWDSFDGEQGLVAAIPFEAPWTGLRVDFCRRESQDVSPEQAAELSIGRRPRDQTGRGSTGLFAIDGERIGQPWRIELLSAGSADPVPQPSAEDTE